MPTSAVGRDEQLEEKAVELKQIGQELVVAFKVAAPALLQLNSLTLLPTSTEGEIAAQAHATRDLLDTLKVAAATGAELAYDLFALLRDE